MSVVGNLPEDAKSREPEPRAPRPWRARVALMLVAAGAVVGSALQWPTLRDPIELSAAVVVAVGVVADQVRRNG